MKTTIVTKESLAQMLATRNPSFVIGRALLAIYNRQTYQEQSGTATIANNGIGFSKPDARLGSIGARMFKAHGELQPWLVKVWMKPASDGFPRICKYVRQLDEIAISRGYFFPILSLSSLLISQHV